MSSEKLVRIGKWVEELNKLLTSIQHGSPEQKRKARAELVKMAKAADRKVRKKS